MFVFMRGGVKFEKFQSFVLVKIIHAKRLVYNGMARWGVDDRYFFAIVLLYLLKRFLFLKPDTV